MLRCHMNKKIHTDDIGLLLASERESSGRTPVWQHPNMTYDRDRGVFAGDVVNQHRRHHQRVVVFLAIYHALRRIVFVACFALVWEYHKNGTTHKGRTINNAMEEKHDQTSM